MEAYLKYYDLLELTPETTTEEIEKKYTTLRTLYSGDSIEIAALNADYPQDMQEEFLLRLDDAYETLKLMLEERKSVVIKKTVVIDEELSEWIKGINCFNGVALKKIRERLGVELKDIFAATRIQPQYLEDIENERFGSFRAEVFLRSYIVEYTRFLSLDTQAVLADYLPRYRKLHGQNAEA